ncbi:hypothetical protein Vadar_017641 [Vaccinium darrowii]|uniref:Uncharacterized protein n=1 Tax=Vaccinium darrowii TaxID=229202 RepID=A0ACB7ZDB5_9ERIC|nr:hypothetical protein Vadar_017641 [Vaccinium darrowii]
MAVMEKLKMFVVQEPVVTASCLIAGFGLFLPAIVRPILDSFETSKQVQPPALNDVVASMTGKKQGVSHAINLNFMSSIRSLVMHVGLSVLENGVFFSCQVASQSF